MPILAFCARSPFNDTSARNMDIVKPIAPSTPTTVRCCGFMPMGREPSFAFVASSVSPTIPNGFPSSSPAATPAPAKVFAIGWTDRSAAFGGLERGTAQLASANNGMISREENGCIRWIRFSIMFPSATIAMSRRLRGSFETFRPLVAGIAIAVTTPAMSAFTPARRSRYHSRVPRRAYWGSRVLTLRSMAVRRAETATAPRRNGSEIALEKHRAITMMAPRSSTVASVRRNGENDGGMRVLKNEYTPIANAMSVAIGIAHPCRVPPGNRFTAR
mmetsp:Transcript_10175/g.25010  ORF Transcript_10175/g.25010 Transcript_10175/m.25010 type:complete len:274 (-) Transcript_10175:852-1673(-)